MERQRSQLGQCCQWPWRSNKGVQRQQLRLCTARSWRERWSRWRCCRYGRRAERVVVEQRRDGKAFASGAWPSVRGRDGRGCGSRFFCRRRARSQVHCTDAGTPPRAGGRGCGVQLREQLLQLQGRSRCVCVCVCV